MLCYVENACQFTYDYGDMWEQYYTSVENNFDKTMTFIAKNNMLEHFKPRLKQCAEWASPCGWGFADTIADLYYEHFPENNWRQIQMSGYFPMIEKATHYNILLLSAKH